MRKKNLIRDVGAERALCLISKHAKIVKNSLVAFHFERVSYAG